MLTINSKREKTKAETFSGNETFADMKSVSITFKRKFGKLLLW